MRIGNVQVDGMHWVPVGGGLGKQVACKNYKVTLPPLIESGDEPS